MSAPPSASLLSLEGHLSLEQAIRAAAAAFDGACLSYAHGTDNALDEASWLILEALGLPPDQAPDYTRTLTVDERRCCNALLRRRIDERVPTAYLVGSAWFAGRAFAADDRALVPRSPFAEFILDDCQGLLEGVATPRILDLCTGGGCIGISCALEMPQAHVDASDISSNALALAAENVRRHGVADRVRLLEGSLYDPVDGSYDLIVSNPPYVDAGDIAAMPAEFGHEPLVGLAAGEDGLDLVRDILSGAAERLTPGGSLVVEVGNSAAAMSATWPALAIDWLTFASGGDGVFHVTREALVDQADALRRAL